MLREVPRYECLLAASEEFPELDISATEACLNILRVGDSVFRVLNGHLQEQGYSQGRFTLLMLLWTHEGEDDLTPAELADQAMVTRATVTGLLDTLEKDGLVVRVGCAKDRRMQRVSLTALAREKIQGILPGHFKRMARLLELLEEGERKELLRLLSKIMERTDELQVEKNREVKR